MNMDFFGSPSKEMGTCFTLGLLNLTVMKNKTFILFKQKPLFCLKIDYHTQPLMHSVYFKGKHFMLFATKVNNPFSKTTAQLRVLNCSTLRFVKFLDVYYVQSCPGILADENYLYVFDGEQRLVAIDGNLRVARIFLEKDIQTLHWFCGYNHIGTPGTVAKKLDGGEIISTTDFRYSCMYRMPGLIELEHGKHLVAPNLPVIVGAVDSYQYCQAGYSFRHTELVKSVDQLWLSWLFVNNTEAYNFQLQFNQPLSIILGDCVLFSNFVQQLQAVTNSSNIIQAKIILIWVIKQKATLENIGQITKYVEDVSSSLDLQLLGYEMESEDEINIASVLETMFQELSDDDFD